MPLVEGCQAPRVFWSPPAIESDAGDQAIQLGESVGVKLDPWQRFAVRSALAEASAGKWAAFEVALLVARQNGKGEVILVLELGKLFLFRDGRRAPLILHSAHLFPTAQEAFRRIRDVVDGSADLRRDVKRISAAHGEEGIELRDGARLRFMARTISGAGRGFSPTDLFFDEAYKLPVEALSANLPALSAQKNPQIFYTSSTGYPDSEVLRSLVERGRRGNDKTLCYMEWSAPDGADVDDHAAWLAANPAIGYRITLETIERERAAMSDEDFGRERLSLWADPAQSFVLDMGAWLASVAPRLEGDVPDAFGVDVAPDRTSAAIGLGVRRGDDTFVEIVDVKRGVDWIVPRCADLAGRWSASFVIDKASPAFSLVDDLELAGCRVVVTSTAEMVTACAGLVDGVADGTTLHDPQPDLDAAVRAARKRSLGDGAFAFGRKASSADISPLVAVTLARWGAITQSFNVLNSIW